MLPRRSKLAFLASFQTVETATKFLFHVEPISRPIFFLPEDRFLTSYSAMLTLRSVSLRALDVCYGENRAETDPKCFHSQGLHIFRQLLRLIHRPRGYRTSIQELFPSMTAFFAPGLRGKVELPSLTFGALQKNFQNRQADFNGNPAV